MKVEVSTSEFEFAHGRKPRGRGGWGFFFGDDRAAEVEWAPGGGILYADAKRWAIEEAKRRGHWLVRVAS